MCLKRICILLLRGPFCGWALYSSVMFGWSYGLMTFSSFTYWFSVYFFPERAMFKSLPVIVGSLSPFSYFSFIIMYFEALLLGAHTFGIVMSWWVECYDCVMFLFIPRNFLSSEVYLTCCQHNHSSFHLIYTQGIFPPFLLFVNYLYRYICDMKFRQYIVLHFENL